MVLSPTRTYTSHRDISGRSHICIPSHHGALVLWNSCHGAPISMAMKNIRCVALRYRWLLDHSSWSVIQDLCTAFLISCSKVVYWSSVCKIMARSSARKTRRREEHTGQALSRVFFSSSNFSRAKSGH